mgnify:CR=1 FL=1
MTVCRPSRWPLRCFRPCRCRSSSGTKKICGTPCAPSPHRAGVRRAVVPLRRPALPELARAAAFCLVPVAVTGGIHLDGYADTSDALSSYGDREKKLEILKDSTVGLRRHPAVLLLCGLLRPLRQCAVHAPGGPVLDAGAGAGAGAVGLCRGGVPAGEGHRPRPHLRHSGRQADRPPLPLRPVGSARPGADGAGRAAGWAAAALLALWRYDFVAKSSLAASPATWPGGFCSGPSCGCWRRWPSASGEECCK